MEDDRQSNSDWDKSSDEEESFDMEQLIDLHKEQINNWLSAHGEELFRSQVSLYLKTKKLDLSYVLQDSPATRKPPLKRQKKFKGTSAMSGGGGELIDVEKECELKESTNVYY